MSTRIFSKYVKHFIRKNRGNSDDNLIKIKKKKKNIGMR